MLTESEEFICFSAVARSGSVTAAAALLDCSKAHVSRKIAALESRLKTKLMHRTTRHINLTDTGQRLRLEAEKLLDQVQSLQMQSRSIKEELSGKFVITAPVSLSTYLLAPELDALKQAFPLIEFEIRSANRVIDLVTEEVDLGIRASHVVNTNLVARHIGQMREVFLASDKFYKVSEFTDIRQLQHNKLLVNPHYVSDGQLKFCCSEDITHIEAKGATLIRDNPISVEMLFQNDYVGWLPDYCQHIERQDHKLINILPQFCGVEWPIYLVFPFQVPLPLKLQKVTAFLQERLSNRLARERKYID